MSRELWAVEPCGEPEELVSDSHDPFECPAATRTRVDFDAIWRRYYDTANRRFEVGLTYDELKQVVLGGTECSHEFHSAMNRAGDCPDCGEIASRTTEGT